MGWEIIAVFRVGLGGVFTVWRGWETGRMRVVGVKVGRRGCGVGLPRVLPVAGWVGFGEFLSSLKIYRQAGQKVVF